MWSHCWKFAAIGVACVTVISIISGCHKSEAESEEQKAMERHENDVQTQKPPRLEYKKLMAQPGTRSMLEAGQFLFQLETNGLLPGAENGTMLKSPTIQRHLTNYPVSWTWTQTMKTGLFVNHYTVVKLSAESPWQLQNAWRTDDKGNTNEVYSVK